MYMCGRLYSSTVLANRRTEGANGGGREIPLESPNFTDHDVQQLCHGTLPVTIVIVAPTSNKLRVRQPMEGWSFSATASQRDTPAQTIGGLPVINEGISGDMLDSPGGGLLRRLSLVGLARPSHVFVHIGINDIVFGQRPICDIRRDFDTLIRYLPAHAPSARIWVQSLLPTSGEHLQVLTAVRELNAYLADVVEPAGLRYLDVYPEMADTQGLLRDGFGTDGLHLTPDGYSAWTAVLESAATQ